jgi:hypothetical protein
MIHRREIGASLVRQPVPSDESWMDLDHPELGDIDMGVEGAGVVLPSLADPLSQLDETSDRTVIPLLRAGADLQAPLGGPHSDSGRPTGQDVERVLVAPQASEVEFDTTYVGGSTACVDDVVADARLQAMADNGRDVETSTAAYVGMSGTVCSRGFRTEASARAVCREGGAETPLPAPGSDAGRRHRDAAPLRRAGSDRRWGSREPSISANVVRR